MVAVGPGKDRGTARVKVPETPAKPKLGSYTLIQWVNVHKQNIVLLF